MVDGRLRVCAGLVRVGAKLADIGTDHAYLPVWLAMNGKISSAVACDVREKPLASGAENIEKYGCGAIVKTRLSDGLDEVTPDDADDIVIAGMGAELIVDILSRADWVRSPDKRLILQPMTKAFVLRKWLCDEGFEILREIPCTHAGKYYTVIHARFDGEKRDRETYYYYCGELDEGDPLSIKYMSTIMRRLKNERRGSAAENKDTAAIDSVIGELDKKFGGFDDDNGE